MESVLLASVIQALSSSLVSVVFALPLIFILHRARGSREAHYFEGFLSFCWICPVMPIVVGMIQTFEKVGLYPYGLMPIVAVHAWMNAPFVTLAGARALGSVSAHHVRLARVLGLGAFAQARILYMRPLLVSLGGSMSLVFFLCITSFNVVLFLGKDYPWPSLGLALYGALFESYLPEKALFYMSLVVGLAILKTLTLGWGRKGRTALKGYENPLSPGIVPRILLAIAFLAWCVPLLMGGGALDTSVLGNREVWEVIMTSALLAFLCACVSTLGAFLITLRFVTRASRKIYGILTFLALPSFLVGGVMYVLLIPFMDVDTWSLVLMILTQSLVTLPWGVRFLLPRAQGVEEGSRRLVKVLGLSFWGRAVYVFAPPMSLDLVKTFSLCAVFSLGDAASVCLFDTSHTTLIALVSKHLETFDVGAAQTLSYVMGGVALVFFVIPQHWMMKRA